jgi:hypothetical protein
METFISDMKVALTHATANSPFGNKQSSSVQKVVFCHSQKSWVILLMNIHKPNRVIYDVSK